MYVLKLNLFSLVNASYRFRIQCALEAELFCLMVYTFKLRHLQGKGGEELVVLFCIFVDGTEPKIFRCKLFELQISLNYFCKICKGVPGLKE